jgi:ABC-type branched-subunit amino acid transport system substrate-binding protein
VSRSAPPWRRLAVAASLLLALAGCGAGKVAGPGATSQETAPATEAPQRVTEAPAIPARPADGKKRVALLAPLSGPAAGVGRAILDAAEMALFDIADENFELLPRDTGGTPEGAQRAAQSVLQEGAQLILGPLTQGEVEAVKPLARAAKVAVIAFSSSVAVADDNTFLLSFLPRQQVRRVVAFSREKGISRYAALAPQTAYGQLVVDELRAAVGEVGGSVVRVELYDPVTSDLTGVVRRLAGFDGRKAALDSQKRQLEAQGDEASRQTLRRLAGQETAGDAGFDAVMLPESEGKLKAIAPLLAYYDVDPEKVKLLGTGLWDEPDLGREPTLVGGWFAAPPPEARAEFEKRFQALYKRRPPRLATLGYDAGALATLLARSDNADFSPATIANPSGYAGMDGIFRFLPNGQVQRGLAVLEVQRNGTVTVSPAPETFQDLAY